MATITSTGSGLASAGSTWIGGVPPVTGDIVVIANGHTVHWDTALTTAGAGVLLGSNAGAVGAAVTINGTSIGSFGKLIVDSGATLYLRGFDTGTNTLMLVNRFGQFNPAGGSTVTGDVAGDFTSIIDNKGQISAIGTAGNLVTFNSPAANYSWANSIVAEAFPNDSATSWPYDPANSIAVGSLSKPWIANAANTGLGSFGDTSLTFGAQSPGTILQTEVASLALVNGAGKYFVNYDMGMVFFFHVQTAGNPSATTTYKYLTNGKGWGITSSQNTTFNSIVLDYCAFSYMGPQTAADKRCLDVQNKLTAGANGGATDRLFYLKNSTVNFCQTFLGLKTCTGTSGDPFLITGNTFNTVQVSSGTFGVVITTYRSSNTYVKIDSNTLNLRKSFLFATASGSVIANTGWTISTNTGTCADFMSGINAAVTWTDGVISGNTLSGIGWALDYRFLQDCGGTSGHVLTVQDNTFSYFKRCVHFASYLTVQRNIIRMLLHHVITSGVLDDYQISTVTIQNNLFFGTQAASGAAVYGSPAVELGYNHRHWIDAFIVSNNTIIDNTKGWIGFGDVQDTTGVSVMTGIEVTNNLALMNTAGTSTSVRRTIATATIVTRLAGLNFFDNNLDYNYNTRYGTGAPNQGTFTLAGSVYNRLTGASRNIPGVSLAGPSYSSNQSGKSLVLTVNSADADVTLAWGGGAAGQLIFATNGTGTLTAGANSSDSGISGLYRGTATNSGAAWNTSFNNAACPIGHWLKITGGVGAGQVRIITNSTATVLTTVPAWTTPPDATSTYAIYKSEVTLTEVDAVNTVIAGVDLRTLPTSTQTDNNIGVTVTNNLTGSDPLLVSAAGTTAASFKFSSSSPARDAGQATNVPTTDYFGSTRPQATNLDIGFYELPQASTYTLTGPAQGVIGVASTVFTVTPNALIVSTTVTPSDSGAGGTFTPTSLTFTASAAAQTFTYTPASLGTKTISTTNNGILSNPASLSYLSLPTHQSNRVVAMQLDVDTGLGIG